MRRRLSLTAAMLVVAAAGCSWSAGESTGMASVERLPQQAATTTAATTTVPPATQECTDPLASLAPVGNLDAGFVAELRERGRLRVGVDRNTLGFASRDQETGEIEGFEVELARAIGRRIFGDAGVVQLVPVTTEEKVSFVRDGTVDMTISAVSMSCKRRQSVDFSAEYYTAHQQFLVRRGRIETLDELQGSTVCVTKGSSSKDLLDDLGVELAEEEDRTGCLLALQDGEVDAYFGHDSFLAGMVVQDPTLEIRTGLIPEDETVSHYGIAISLDRPELVRLVNEVLESMRADRSWETLHDELMRTLPKLPDQEQPRPVYRAETS